MSRGTVPHSSGLEGRAGPQSRLAARPAIEAGRVDLRHADRVSDLLTAHPGVGRRDQRRTPVAADQHAKPPPGRGGAESHGNGVEPPGGVGQEVGGGDVVAAVPGQGGTD